jgi:hypothetical protein
MTSPVKAGTGNHAKHRQGAYRHQRWRRGVGRIQEEPCASPDALFRVRPRATEDRGRKRKGKHGKYLSNKGVSSWNNLK